jgi:hypothetical protein
MDNIELKTLILKTTKTKNIENYKNGYTLWESIFIYLQKNKLCNNYTELLNNCCVKNWNIKSKFYLHKENDDYKKYNSHKFLERILFFYKIKLILHYTHIETPTLYEYHCNNFTRTLHLLITNKINDVYIFNFSKHL